RLAEGRTGKSRCKVSSSTRSIALLQPVSKRNGAPRITQSFCQLTADNRTREVYHGAHAAGQAGANYSDERSGSSCLCKARYASSSAVLHGPLWSTNQCLA